MRVRDMMTRDVATCRTGDDLGTAGKLMAETGCGCLPVSDDGRKLVGFLTDRDVCTYLCDADVARTLRAVGHALPHGRSGL